MKYTVYLIRHGRTWFNNYNKMQGWSDSPLTTEGTAVAEKAAQQLKDVPFDLAISSDARRAIDTCRIIISENVNHEQLVPQKSSRFREEFYGYFEGMNSDEAWHMILTPHGYTSYNDAAKKVGLDQTKDWMKVADPFHDAEDSTEYWQRLEAGFNDLDHLAFDGAKVLLISHGTTIRSLAQRYGDGSFEVDRGPANASLTTLIREDGQNTITNYNQNLFIEDEL